MQLSDFFNVELAANPYNWVVITLMAVFGAFVLYLAFGPSGDGFA